MCICIVCHKLSDKKIVEHIIPESFGNKDYIIPNGLVCEGCNNRFSKFESSALSNTVFVMERARFGTESKKGKRAKGKVGELTIEGSEDLTPEMISVKGLGSKNVRNFDPKTKTFELVVPTFDKSEVATSKMLLKVGLEAVFKSRKLLFLFSYFKELREFLKAQNNDDWPFLTSDYEVKKFRSIPPQKMADILKQIHCEVKFLKLNSKTLLFKFKYGSIPMVINLLNRDLEWIKLMKKEDTKAVLYPEHFNRKLV